MKNTHGLEVVASGQIIERPFIRVALQSGLPSEVGVNGCRVEDVISVAIECLERYQMGPLACPENEEAIHDLKLATEALELRRQHRLEQGVLNTMYRHEPVRTEDEDHDFSATGS